MLDCLFWYAPDPVSIAQLTAFTWGQSERGDRRNMVHVYVGYLRRKLRASRQVVIQTLRGVGYAFAEQDTTIV